MSARKKYTPEYRIEAARLVIETGRPNAHVAAALGVGEQLLGRWVQQERERAGAAVPVAGAQWGEGERADLACLRVEVRGLRLDNEFLGKAAAFFASKPLRRNSSN